MKLTCAAVVPECVPRHQHAAWPADVSPYKQAIVIVNSSICTRRIAFFRNLSPPVDPCGAEVYLQRLQQHDPGPVPLHPAQHHCVFSLSTHALQLFGHPHTLLRISGKAAIWSVGHTWASLLLMLKSAARCARTNTSQTHILRT